MKLNEIQNFLKKLLSKVAHPRIGAVIGLQEEVGKLSKSIMDIEIYGKPINKIELENNCADIFFSIIDVCNSYDIDLGNITKKKIKIIESKINRWEKEHGKELKIRREKFD